MILTLMMVKSVVDVDICNYDGERGSRGHWWADIAPSLMTCIDHHDVDICSNNDGERLEKALLVG